jgi:hypothetical protein
VHPYDYLILTLPICCTSFFIVIFTIVFGINVGSILNKNKRKLSLNIFIQHRHYI